MSTHSTNLPNTKEQINVIYIVRALAILGVIIVHVSSIPISQMDINSLTYSVANFLNIFMKWGTTTFIFLSALVLFYSYYDRPVNRKLFYQFYKRRFLYIIIPYLIFSVIYYIIQIYYSYGESWTAFAEFASLRDFAEMALYGKAFYHLYFVYISIQFYIFFPLLLWILQRFPALTKHLIWIGLLLYCAFTLYNYYILKYNGKSSLAITYITYYFLGTYCGIYYEKIELWLNMTKSKLFTHKLWFWVPLWSVWLGISMYHVHVIYNARVNLISIHPLLYDAIWLVHGLSAAIILLQLSYFIIHKLPVQIVNILIHLGVVSFGIYIVHALILFYYSRMDTNTDPLFYKLNVLGGFAATLLLSWAIVGLSFKYIRGSWILFGSSPKVHPYIQHSVHRSSQQKPAKSVNL